MGDFNHHPDALQQVRIWRLHGWQEIQVVASERWGHVPTPTSKGAAFRDHIFLSPEALALLSAVEVRDVFAEHSSVIASLSLDGFSQIQTWPLPCEIPWENINIPAWQATTLSSGARSADANTWLQQFAAGFECSLRGHCLSIPSAQLPQPVPWAGKAPSPPSLQSGCTAARVPGWRGSHRPQPLVIGSEEMVSTIAAPSVSAARYPGRQVYRSCHRL